MGRFHINKHGIPAPCKAQPGNCPLGGAEQHFSNQEEAQEFIDKKNAEKYGILNYSSKVHHIPEGTPKPTWLDGKLFVEEGYQLERSGDIWVQLNSNGDLVGTMDNPILTFTANGKLVNIVDKGNQDSKISLKGLEVLRSMARLNLTPDTIKESVRDLHFYEPKNNLQEYENIARLEANKKIEGSLAAFRNTLKIKGGDDTSELFSKVDNGNEVTKYFKAVESEKLQNDSKEGKYINPKPINFDPKVDSWTDIPSAKDFPAKAWMENKLDIQRLSDSWAVTNINGEIYGKLENPAVIVNFQTESIETIGELENIDDYCNKAQEQKELNLGDPSPIDKLGYVELDDKSNNLNKIRNMLKYSWAFRE